MIIDVHCHYTFTERRRPGIERFSFEPLDGDEGLPVDSCIAPRIVRQTKWKVMRWLMGIDARLPAGDELDADIERVYDAHLLAPGPVDRYVLLAFDWYHRHDGTRPQSPQRASELGGDIYTSNSLVRDACRRRPDRYLFGASIHPYRRHATQCVREVFAAGACLLKWLPLHQNIDIRDERTIAVLRCCAEIGLPILVHYNEEFTLRTQHPEWLEIAPLLEVLARLRREGRMPTTIVAHVATPVAPWGRRASYHRLMKALREDFADAPLFADVSALTSWGKIRFLRQLVREQDLHGKLLFGSDFPVPVALPRLRRDLGRGYAAVRAARAWPQQIALAYRHMGFNEIVFRRAAELLPNVHYFSRGIENSG